MSKAFLVVVDTSVFIDFFRGDPSETFKILLSNNQIILSHTVKLEILKGTRKRDEKIVETVLSGLREKDTFPDPNICLMLLNKAKGSGFLGGIPDLLILADAYETKSKLFTSDQKLYRVAKRLGIEVLD